MGVRAQFACVAFNGGSLMSARTPSDREVLAADVLDCVRANAAVRLRLGRETWRVQQVSASHLVCSHCQRPIHEARCGGPRSRKAKLRSLCAAGSKLSQLK
jgi:hypothetical protein